GGPGRRRGRHGDPHPARGRPRRGRARARPGRHLSAARGGAPVERTVRDAAFDVLRRRGLDRIFANPGSTEISLLTDLPDDLDFVLALHEGAVVGLATGYATATGRPALVVLH